MIYLKGNFWKKLYDCGGDDSKGCSRIIERGKNKGRSYLLTGRKYHSKLVKSDANYNRKNLNKFMEKEIGKELEEFSGYEKEDYKTKTFSNNLRNFLQ